MDIESGHRKMTDNARLTCPQHPYAGGFLTPDWRMVCPRCHTFLYWAKPPGLLEKPTCGKCGGLKAVKLVRVTAANGQDHVVWHCTNCKGYVKDGARLWLPAKLVSEFLTYWSARLPTSNLPSSIDKLPILQDYTGQEPCAICGSLATEYNHFMPQVFREDADVTAEWKAWDALGAWLCDHHHRLWHRKVAPLTALSQVKRQDALTDATPLRRSVNEVTA